MLKNKNMTENQLPEEKFINPHIKFNINNGRHAKLALSIMKRLSLIHFSVKKISSLNCHINELSEKNFQSYDESIAYFQIFLLNFFGIFDNILSAFGESKKITCFKTKESSLKIRNEEKLGQFGKYLRENEDLIKELLNARNNICHNFPSDIFILNKNKKNKGLVILHEHPIFSKECFDINHSNEKLDVDYIFKPNINKAIFLNNEKIKSIIIFLHEAIKKFSELLEKNHF